ncbi:MAG: sensory transduction histidine kinase [Flavipsychrobacter sp.]|nr:sensory transduction histidine kinase [Flavipsychrobacter sp.]
MVKTISMMDEDIRLQQIFDQIIRLANADFQTQGTLSEKGDDLDSIIVGLNLLGEELESYTLKLRDSQEELRNTLAQLTEAQHLAHIGSWEWDIATNTVNWTEELYRIYGRRREDFESNFENFLACIHADDQDYVNAIIQNAYQKKEAFSFSHRISRPDGTEKIVDCKADIYLNRDGTLKRMTGTAQDVTDLRKAEEKIIRLAAIVESSRDAIISKTIGGSITSWNKQAELLFGYNEEEVLGKHISVLFPLDRLDEEEEILRQINQGMGLINYETERMKKDGSVIDVAVTISPVKDPSGKIIGISNILRDITDKKQAQERLIAYTQALEQKNKETEQFAYIASHDLQEPLRTITNYIGLFETDYKGKLDASADMYLKFITGASNRMKMLITDILEYTRIENDKSPVEVDCNVLVDEVINDMQLTITENNATVQVSSLPVITGYASSFKSLFQNLISNAIKFKKTDVQPIVNISARDDGKDWVFEVRDNGIGIEKQYFDKIFMIFQRLHARTEYQGSGIGLAHCKKIVDLRGGKIWVESEVGTGSSFYFSVPKKYVL